MYTPQIYNQTTQTMEAQESIWIQIANALRALGQVFIAFGRLLIRIGEFIYELFFH